MNDDIKDIEPEIVEKIMAHADTFIDIDRRVDEVINWGEKELHDIEERMRNDGTLTVENIRAAGKSIEDEVHSKLQAVESDVQAQYG